MLYLTQASSWFFIQQSEATLIDAATEVWSNAPQRIVMIVDRLMSLRLVSGTVQMRGKLLGDEARTVWGWEER